MDREFKFRAWIQEKNLMVNVVSLHSVCSSNNMAVVSYSSASKEYELEKIPSAFCNLLEFTGLNDKNGKDIYEGDIIKRVSELMPYSPHNITGIVKFHEYGWVIDNGKEAKPLFCEISVDEVIGNIYQNSEILGG